MVALVEVTNNFSPHQRDHGTLHRFERVSRCQRCPLGIWDSKEAFSRVEELGQDADVVLRRYILAIA